MSNKLIISTFLFLISFLGYSQVGEKNVVTAESEIQYEPLVSNNKIKIYPNPVVDYIIIQIDNSTLVNTEFEMHSIIGTEVKISPEQVGPGKYKVQVKDFSTGYYFLVVKDEMTRFKKAYRFLKK